jgi:hypothetical protein
MCKGIIGFSETHGDLSLMATKVRVLQHGEARMKVAKKQGLSFCHTGPFWSARDIEHAM